VCPISSGRVAWATAPQSQVGGKNVNILTQAEASQYLGEAYNKYWSDSEASYYSTRFKIDTDCGRVNALARALGGLFCKDTGCILIVKCISIFPSSEDLYLAHALRSHFGEVRPISDAPAHVFSGREQDACASMIHVSILNFWDFLIVSENKRNCVCGSHDEFIDIFGVEISEFQEICAAVRRLDLPELFRERTPSGAG